MILLMTMYVAAVCLTVLLMLTVVEKARLLAIPSVLAGCIITAGLLYVSCLIPGSLGILYVSVIYICFILLAVVLLLALQRFHPAEIVSPPDSAPRSFFDYILIIVGIIAALPLFRQIQISWPWALRHPSENLGWDTVSYHLPGFIEFFQAHSLWSLEGPYQSYSFAFELVGNFFSMPFHAHWGLVLADCFAATLIVVALSSVSRMLVAQLPLRRPVSWIPCAVLVIGIWVQIHTESIGDIGKNDVFMAACLIAALAFLLELATDTSGSFTRRNSLIALTGISAGLALATKPSALGFVPFFAGAVWLESLARKESWKRAFLAALVVLVLSGLLGGFWLMRNLIVFGKLSAVSSGWDSSLIANLNNPALYEWKSGSRRFVLGLLAVIPATGWLLVYQWRNRKVLLFVLLILFHLTACVAFAITPHAIFHGSLSSSVWKLRLGMPLFISAALIYSLTVVYLFAVLSVWRGWIKSVLICLPVLVLMLALPFYWQQNPASGLPGYETVRGLLKTEIYQWVQTQQSPIRIYSAGLRPYGLYGENWANKIFYDLNLSELSPVEEGKIRVAAIVRKFSPNLILISVDPNSDSGAGAEKPDVVKWMRGLPECFEEVFNDETVSGFRVKAGAGEQLKSMVPEGYVLKMGG